MKVKLNETLNFDKYKDVILQVDQTGSVFNSAGEELSSFDTDGVFLNLNQQTYPARLLDNEHINIITFVELRGKSDYSIQQSVASIKNINNKSEVGLALTDLGVGFGLFQFNQLGVQSGKKNILGCEFYIKSDGYDKYQYDNLVLLAKNKDGYHDMCRLITLGASRVKASNTKSQVKPYLEFSDFDSINTQNFIVLSAYDDGFINKSLWLRTNDGNIAAEKYVEALLKYFNKEDIYLEIQYQKDSDTYLEDDFSIRETITELAEKYNLKEVITNNYHMINRDDKDVLDVMQSLGQKKSLSENPKLMLESEPYIHTSQDMERVKYPEHLLDHTIEIWNKCESYNLYSKTNFMPKFITPSEFNSDVEYFEYVSKKGLVSRLKVDDYDQVSKDYKERLEEEMKLIEDMGFVGYFLITADFISYAKRNFDAYDDETVARWKKFIKDNDYNPAPIAIGPSRGSAGGSLVSYAMSITDIDPLKFNLLFERFLNPERVSMPDIDTDIPDTKRAEVIHYVQDYYNISQNPVESRVAGIGVFGTYKIKNVLKAIVRALYKNVDLGNKLAKFVDDPEMSIEDYLLLPEVSMLVSEDARVKRVLSLAPKFMGLVSNLSQHAAGYVIAPTPVTDYLPTTFVHNKDTNKMEQISAYTYVEAIGLLKMDFLGLRSMSIIQDAIDDINQNTKQNLTIAKILDKAITDLDTYKTLSKGYSFDIFQLGSDGMKDMITRVLADVNDPDAELKAESGDYFSRLIAGISIYRPGPMKFMDEFIDNALHPENIEFAVPEISDLLKQSYGLLIYQESIMALFRVIAGTSLGRADILRRAISKKDPEVLAAQKNIFIYGSDEENIPGGVKNTGRSVEELEQLWLDIEAFASYGFNKSHAAGYAHISIIMAWLSHYYPAYFAASNLNHPKNADNLRDLITYYKRKNLKILPPNINKSKDVFSVNSEDVLFGLDGVKYLASNAPQIFTERSKNGAYTSLFNLLDRLVNAKIDITKKSVEALIYSGALDDFDMSRDEKIFAVQKIADVISLIKKDSGTVFNKVPGYFERFIKLPNVKQLSEKELLQKEYEFTGFYISGHPTDKYMELGESYLGFKNIEDLESSENNLAIIGIVKSHHRIMTKTGKPMAFMTVEDITGSIDITVFPEEFSDFGRLIKTGNIVVVTGYTQDNGKFIVTTIKNAEDVKLSTEIHHIQLNLGNQKSDAMKKLQFILKKVDTALPYSIKIPMSYVFDNKEYFSTKKVKCLEIPFDNETINYVKSIIGIDNLNIIWKSKLI